MPRPSFRATPLLLATLAMGTFPTAHAAGQERPFPYSLGVLTDAPLLGVGALAFVAGEYRDFGYESEIGPLTPDSVNWFDRVATRRFSSAARTYSDYSRDALILGAGLAVASEIGIDARFLTLGTMAVETGLVTLALTIQVKALAERRRPYLFNDDLSVAERADFARADGTPLESFVSGHASTAFAAAMFATTVLGDLKGWPGYAHELRWGALGIAGTTAIARVAGGEHYPTDVLVGAAVGSFVGWFVPWIHRNGNQPSWGVILDGRDLGFRVSAP